MLANNTLDLSGIEQRRIEAGVAMTKLSEKAGLRPNYYGRMMRGDIREPSGLKLRMICEALDKIEADRPSVKS